MADEPTDVRSFLSRSPEQTEALGACLGEVLEAGAVLALCGDLGSGKTCFARGVARGLGVEEPVTSPTFALLATYEGRLPLQHFDAWMEGRGRALLADGAGDCLGAEGVAVIEWAERVEEWLPREHLRVELNHNNARERLLTLAAWGAAPGRSCAGAWLRALEVRGGAVELSGSAGP
ncbi:MAG: tRNA (adenosine(37)-N6)-threonylcarbamoyltransferase complex ATPase subunit type 1 TsaE [Planctomycetes bacterium]|jgi:tRNA threonylcarbamoyladenosine biosynthesis protein TsaE|nr:tRNA (adenosine(37)-N6)-threonylcarbamoyltransferase complex ATPase subunit type 1 TsaE [Planctomycetota bacterium]MDP6410130.1 tRNA (adenosine(37)-N6)-threonylcarbamoyltransferase complex ATPase subunit type 1 TsaE [Planctomycetota bacterium]